MKPTSPQTFLKTLQADYPEFAFRPGTRFTFRPPKTIIFEPTPLEETASPETTTSPETTAPSQKSTSSVSQKYCLSLLHELSHAILQHRDFKTHIDRLKMELAAWERAKLLAKKYGVLVDQDFIEAELDTYRDWLHAKSRCRTCGLTRYQSPDGRYHCPFCDK